MAKNNNENLLPITDFVCRLKMAVGVSPIKTFSTATSTAIFCGK